jgi:hypothetical protein
MVWVQRVSFFSHTRSSFPPPRISFPSSLPPVLLSLSSSLDPFPFCSTLNFYLLSSAASPTLCTFNFKRRIQFVAYIFNIHTTCLLRKSQIKAHIPATNNVSSRKYVFRCLSFLFSYLVLILVLVLVLSCLAVFICPVLPFVIPILLSSFLIPHLLSF